MPSLRTMKFAERFSEEMKPLNTVLKALTGGTTKRAVASGSVIATFFGTSSPNTIERKVATARASTSATAVEA